MSARPPRLQSCETPISLSRSLWTTAREPWHCNQCSLPRKPRMRWDCEKPWNLGWMQSHNPWFAHQTQAATILECNPSVQSLIRCPAIPYQHHATDTAQVGLGESIMLRIAYNANTVKSKTTDARRLQAMPTWDYGYLRSCPWWG